MTSNSRSRYGGHSLIFACVGMATICGLPASAQDTKDNWMHEFVQARVNERNLQAIAADPTRRLDMDLSTLLGPRIVGGTEAGPNDNPFQVGLLRRAEADDFRAQFCGGSLIAETVVVTAAHCSDFLTADQVQVLTGTRGLDGTGERHDVARIIVHPDWDSQTFDNDVAVWELESPATGVPLAELAFQDGPVGDDLLATGWGTLTEGGARPTVLQRVAVPLVDRGDCNDANSYDGAITDNMLCAGVAAGGRDACQGDSGGPLTRGADNATLTGITSWGFGCARPNLFGVYTRVSRDGIRDFVARAVASTSGVGFVQSRFGARGNFEVAAPLVDGGLGHFWRNNDSGLNWFGPFRFAEAGGRVDGLELIQSNFGAPGNLEIAAHIDGRLVHYWRDSGPTFRWHGPFDVASGIDGEPGLVQSRFGARGNFEVVVAMADGGLAHFWRNNDSGFTWAGPFRFAQSLGPVDAVDLIQSNFGAPGNLEVVVRIGDRLAHFWRDSGPTFRWNGPFYFASGVAGSPSLVQGRFGQRGNFEVVVPMADGSLAHYWRNNDAGFAWSGPTRFAPGLGQVAGLDLVQSNFGSPGNLEVVAQVGEQVAHFWRDSGPAFEWHGPFYFGRTRELVKAER